MNAEKIDTNLHIDHQLKLIPPTWRDSVQGIMHASTLLRKIRAAYGSEKFYESAHRVLGLSMTSVAKVMNVNANPALANPDNWKHLPAAWATLYLLHHLPKDELQKMIDTGEIHAGTDRYKAADLNGHALPYERKSLSGSTKGNAIVPPGANLLELAYSGIAMEKDGISPKVVCQKLNLARRTYCWVRDIILLSGRNDLRPEESRIMQNAVKELKNGSLRVGELWKQVRPIVDRKWHPRAARIYKPQKHTLKAQGKKLSSAVTIIADTCEAAAEISDVSIGGLVECERALKQLTRAQSSLRQIVKSVRRQIDHHIRINPGDTNA